MQDPLIDRANAAAIDVIVGARPYLVDLAPASEVIPGLDPSELLHAGPPLADDDVWCNALRGAIAGTLVLDGAALDVAAAQALLREGNVRLRSGHERHAMCTFGGVIAASTPVFVVENRATGARAYAAINEGRGAALRYGSTAPETLQRVRWLHDEFASVLGAAIRSKGGYDLQPIIRDALAMGDELHSRQKAASALFQGAVAPAVCELASTPAQASRVLAFLVTNDFFFLPLAMASAESALAPAHGVARSSIVTAIAFNGARCGIRVSGLPDWCTAPAPSVAGRYFKGFGELDAGPVIGDSEIMETLGLGASALAGAPVLANYLGGDTAFGRRITEEMYAITATEHPTLTLPCLDGRGTPLGIEVRKVLATGITPAFNTGIAHVDAGIGQIGAGHGRVPIECFEQAGRLLDRLADVR